MEHFTMSAERVLCSPMDESGWLRAYLAALSSRILSCKISNKLDAIFSSIKNSCFPSFTRVTNEDALPFTVPLEAAEPVKGIPVAAFCFTSSLVNMRREKMFSKTSRR
jgi:hypothetical protein